MLEAKPAQASAKKPAPRVRLQSIQSLRGIAAFLVLMVHSINMVYASQEDIGYFFFGTLGQSRGFGAVGVDIFFVISGFVMAFSVAGKPEGFRGAWQFLKLRWIRIAPPYLIVSAIIIVSQQLNGTLSWRGVANTVLFVPFFDTESFSVTPLTIGWTLSYEFSFYLLIALAVAFSLARRSWLVAVFILALVLVGAMLQPENYLAAWFFNPIYLEFGLGILAYQAWHRGWLNHLKPLWLALFVLGVAALVTSNFVGFGGVSDMFRTLDGSLSLVRFVIWGIPSLFVFTGVLIFWRHGTGLISRAFAVVGDASYSLYLVHLPVVALVAKIVSDFLNLWIPADLYLLLLVVCGVVAGYIYYRMVEWPVTRFLRARAERSFKLGRLEPAN